MAAYFSVYVYIFFWLCWVFATALTMYVYMYFWLCWASAAAFRLARGAALHCSVWASLQWPLLWSLGSRAEAQ